MASPPSLGRCGRLFDSPAPSVCPELLVFLSPVWNGLARQGQGRFYLWLWQVKLLGTRGGKYLSASRSRFPLS